MLNIFESSSVQEILEIMIGLCKQVFIIYPIKFLDLENKTKLEAASLSCFLEFLWKRKKESITLLSLKKLLKIKLVETEAAVQRCSVQKVFLQISQNSKETLTQVLSCELCQISKNIFLHTTPLVAASEEIEIDLK